MKGVLASFAIAGRTPFAEHRAEKPRKKSVSLNDL
jgi:hypothetical protein